jgi:chaperonin GroES
MADTLAYDMDYIGDEAPMQLQPQDMQVPTHLRKLVEWALADNIAGDLDDETLQRLGQEVHEKYRIDDASRSDWAKSARRAIDLVGGEKETKHFPFENASNVKYPLLLSAVQQFASRAYPAIVKGPDIVKAKIEGRDKDGEKLGRAQRIEKHMSYQLLHEMEEWEEDTDALLHQLPVVGCCFRKTYWDGARRRPRSEMISALDLVVNINVPSLEDAPQVAHEFYRYPHQVEENIRKGIYIDQQLGRAEAPEDQDQHPDGGEDKFAPHKFVECHCYWDLDGDGVEEPWIVTVHDATQKVVRVAAGYRPDAIELDDETGDLLNIEREHYFTKYIFWPDPKGGFYGVGLGHALQDLSETINTTLNQMIDAGTLQNAGGGFIGSGMNMKKATYRFAPGVYHTVATRGATIRDAIVHIDHPGPSTVLFQLMAQLVDVSKEISGNQDVLQGDVGGVNMQPTTLMALIEQGLQKFTAVYKRIYHSLGKEFRRLGEINAQYLSDEEYAEFLDTEEQVSVQADYATLGMDVYPMADPNMVTHMQRAARNQFLMELSDHPAYGKFLQKPVILSRILRDAQIENPDEVVIAEPEPNPVEEAQVKKLQAEAQKAEAEHRLTQAKIIEIEDKVESGEIERGHKRVEGAKKMMEAENVALDTSIKEAMAGRLIGIEDVESVSIQGVGSIKEQDKDPKAVSGQSKQGSNGSTD